MSDRDWRLTELRDAADDELLGQLHRDELLGLADDLRAREERDNAERPEPDLDRHLFDYRTPPRRF